MNDKDVLNEAQEQLLLRWCDGEASWFERIKARKLMADNQAARVFVEETLKVADTLQQVDREQSAELPQVNLWDRIATRIEREERSRRIMADAEESFGSWLQIFSGRLAWSGAGAVVAGLAVFFVLHTAPAGSGLSTGVDLAKENTPQNVMPIQPVNLAPEERELGVLPLPREALVQSEPEQPFELDWMRSTGRVRLIQDPNKRMAIIWVNRPTFAHPTLAPGEEGLVVVNRREPNAIPVANR